MSGQSSDIGRARVDPSLGREKLSKLLEWSSSDDRAKAIIANSKLHHVDLDKLSTNTWNNLKIYLEQKLLTQIFL